MNENTPDPSSKGTARRRLLLRGTFAAPAALTLFSGSVAARSIRNCVTKQVANSDLTPIPTAAPGSTYVRVQLQRFDGKDGPKSLTNRYSRWIRGSDVTALQAAGANAPYLTSTQWQLYDRGTTDNVSNCGTNWNPASAYAPPYSTSTSPGYILTSGSPSEAGGLTCGGNNKTILNSGPTADQWVALRVNAAGDIVGVVGIGDTSGTSAISQSCWTSFRVG